MSRCKSRRNARTACPFSCRLLWTSACMARAPCQVGAPCDGGVSRAARTAGIRVLYTSTSTDFHGRNPTHVLVLFVPSTQAQPYPTLPGDLGSHLGLNSWVAGGGGVQLLLMPLHGAQACAPPRPPRSRAARGGGGAAALRARDRPPVAPKSAPAKGKAQIRATTLGGRSAQRRDDTWVSS